jgi:hypothetical protein
VPADVIAPPGRHRSATTAPTATGKWLTASLTDDIPAVVAAAFEEAERRDPEHRRPWVALVDGNTTQIQAIHTEATRRHTKLSIVLDFIHVLEYLWKAAWAFFDTGDPDAEAWVADQATKILEGKAADVAADVAAARHATTTPRPNAKAPTSPPGSAAARHATTTPRPNAKAPTSPPTT